MLKTKKTRIIFKINEKSNRNKIKKEFNIQLNKY